MSMWVLSNMKSKTTKLICVGLIAMLLASCMHKPLEQKQNSSITPTNTTMQTDTEDLPVLKFEKVFTIPTDDNIFRPLTLQGNQFFYRDLDIKTGDRHYIAVDIDSKKIQWDLVPGFDFPFSHTPQIFLDLVLFPSDNFSRDHSKSKILALDINNGSMRWVCNLTGSCGSLTLIQKTLFVTTWTQIYALDFQTGKLLWSKSIYDFFPGYSKEKDYYHIDAFDSNQNTLFIDYILETDISKPMPSSYYGCLAIEPGKGSFLWKYENKPLDRDRFFGESFEVIGPYLLIDGFTLVDPKNGKMLWQYKPDNPEFKNPKTYYIGYIASLQLLIYQTNREEGYSTYLSGLDITTGQQKWKQGVNVKGNPNINLSSFTVDQNHLTDQILTFNPNVHDNQTLIDSLNVYDSKNGKLLQSYEMPVSCWFRDLKSEIRFHEGWWYFIGETSKGDTLFRFQLNK
jgi:outer membrane protein assembly factor BamB